MKHYLRNPVFRLKSETYLIFIMLLAPLLNFLSGINLDIYSPSMPIIATTFHTSVTAVKDTITSSLIGWTCGALFFGILIDSLGRKKVLIYGLSIYVIASFLAPLCHTIHLLMAVRLVQGFTVAALTIGCRAIVVDNITGHRYMVAILYTSVGYGLGPIVGPFIGGILQHYIGWEANFIALAVISSALLLTLFLLLDERMPEFQPLNIKDVTKRFRAVFKNKLFVAGITIGGILQIQMMLYAALGPFVVENTLHKSAIVYGNCALVAGVGYLIGTLGGRLLLIRMHPKTVCYVGFGVLAAALIAAYGFAAFTPLGLVTITLPMTVICISSGLIFPSIIAANIRLFPKNVGACMAVQSTTILLVGALGIFIASHLSIVNLFQFANLFLVLALAHAVLFFLVYRKIFA